MADAEDYADAAIDVVGGLGGAVVSVLGGGPAGAQAAMVGTGAIKQIIGMATGSDERKRAEAAAKSGAVSEQQLKLEAQRLALEERRIKMQEEEARERRERDKIRDFDAPMYRAAPQRTAAAKSAPTWQPTTLRQGDRIVEIHDLPEKMQPLVNDARDSVLLRQGDSRDVVLVDRGPPVDGAMPPADSQPPVAAERPDLVARHHPLHSERAGDPHRVDVTRNQPISKEA